MHFAFLDCPGFPALPVSNGDYTLHTETSPRLLVSLGEVHGYSGTLRWIFQSGLFFNAYPAILKYLKRSKQFGVSKIAYTAACMDEYYRMVTCQNAPTD